MTIYPIRQFDDGTQLINWSTEQPRDDHKPNGWATPGRIEDFIKPFQNWRFNWLDVPDLIAGAEFILEYPMGDRAQPPDVIIKKVEELTGGEPFERLKDINDPTELVAISENYKTTAGYSLEKVSRQS